MDAGTETDYIGTGVIMNSWELRKALWSSAFGWIENRPIVGHGGLDSFLENSPKFFLFVPSGLEGVYAHSVYVQLLFEVGLLGLLAFLGIAIQFFNGMVRLAAFDRHAAIIGGSLCLAYLGLCYSDNMLYYIAANWYFFALLGVLGALIRVNADARMSDAATHHQSIIPEKPSPFSVPCSQGIGSKRKPFLIPQVPAFRRDRPTLWPYGSVSH